jgi:hypothetical protein
MHGKHGNRSNSSLYSPLKIGEGNNPLQRSVRKVLAVLKWKRQAKPNSDIGLKENASQEQSQAEKVCRVCAQPATNVPSSSITFRTVSALGKIRRLGEKIFSPKQRL